MRRLTRLLLFLWLLPGCSEDSSIEERDVPLEDLEEIIEFGDPGKALNGCYPAFENNELNVVTWNIKNFPAENSSTLEKLTEIIPSLDADIIAVQEIADVTSLLELESQLDGWGAVYANVRYGQELGFVYNKRAFTSLTEPLQLFDDDSYAFPRQAVLLMASHVSGLEVVFINIHLKCCGEDGSDEQERRRIASDKIKTYIDQNHPNDAVIVLGDFNDEIIGPSSPFQNFIDDEAFAFADKEIELGPDSNWSYPSWPSHLDHILISDELFENLTDVQTIVLESCVTDFATEVSDHRPVLASFSIN